MVMDQLRARGIRDERVLDVMAALPREAFLPAAEADVAYADSALPIPSGQSLSQPYMVALMTELLAPRPGMRLLEVGTGSGYQAAVLAAIGCHVLTIERHADLTEQARAALADARLEELFPGLAGRIEIEIGDGSLGWPASAPFEGILVTAAAPRIPESLRGQLADGGRLVLPVGPMRGQELIQVTRSGETYEERPFGGCVFVPLIGAEGYAEEETRRRRWRPGGWI